MAEGRVVLGVDPGSHHLGWGVVRVQGRQILHLASGVADAPRADLPIRLGAVAGRLAEVVEQFAPDSAAVEAVFAGRNPMSALALGQARGAALVVLARAQVPVFAYAATAIKQATCGSGRADKAQVGEMVRRLLGLPAPLRVDAADALAAAWCHASVAPRGLALARPGRRA